MFEFNKNFILNNFISDDVVHIPNINDVPGTSSITGISEYKNRIIPVLPKNHKILLPEYQCEITYELIDYFREFFLSELTRDNVFSVPLGSFENLSHAINNNKDILKEIEKFPGEKIFEFYSSEELNSISKKTKKSLFMNGNVSSSLNNKEIFRRILRKNNILVPAGKLLKKGSNSNASIEKFYKKLVLSGVSEFSVTKVNSCSGQGINRFKELQDGIDIVKKLSEASDLLLEGWCSNVVSSPSCQIWLEDDVNKSCIFSYTDQLLHNELIHRGNIKLTKFLNNSNFLKTIKDTIKVVHDFGGRGIVGLDLLVCYEKNELVTYVIEINARQTGAIYGPLLFNAIGLSNNANQNWLICNDVPVNDQYSLHDYIVFLESKKIHYNHTSQKGVLVMSNGNFKNNKAMVMCLSSSENELFELLNEASCGQNNKINENKLVNKYEGTNEYTCNRW